MRNVLLVVGVITLAPTIYFFTRYLEATESQSKSNLMIAGAFFAVSLVCFCISFFMRFRSEGNQDISITKF